jgi:hypothetical protein
MVNGHTQTITPSAVDQRFTIKYQHHGSDSGITITFAEAPDVADVLILSDVYFYDCPMAVAYYAMPQALSADDDEPEGSLALFDALLTSASLLQLPISMGYDRNWAIRRYAKELDSFKDFIGKKGKNQVESTRGNLYGL